MRQKLPVAVVVLVYLSFIMGTSEFIVMGILPDIAQGLGVEYTMVGALVSVFALSYGIASPLLSNALGRYSRYNVMLVLTAVFLVSDIWSMVCSSYLSMMLSRVLTAAASGVLFSISLTYAVELVSQEVRATTLAWMYAGFNISSILGVPIGVAVCNAFGWRATFMFILFMIVLGLVLVVGLLPRNVGHIGSEAGGSSAEMLRDPRIIMGFMLTVCAFGASYLVFTYITPILEDVIGVSDNMVGIGLMLFGLMCLISNLVAGRISNMGGLRHGRFIFLVQSLVFLAFPMALSNSVSGFVMLMVIGFMMYLMNSSIQLLLVEVAAKDYPKSISLASALNPTAFSVGIMLGSQLAGVIYDSAGPQYLGYGSVIFALGAVVLAVVVCRYCSKPGRETSVT